MMSEQENTQVDVQESDQIEVEVVESESVEPTVTTEEDLTKESKNIQKRINKKNQQIMAAEQRVAKLQDELAAKTQEAKSYYDQVLASRSEALTRQEEAHNAKQIQADEIYKKAIESNDAELISKADTLKSELAIEKEKIRVAKQKVETEPKQEQEQPVTQTQYQPQPQPTKEAIKWHEKNSWYGDLSDENNIQASQFAYFTHNALINEGYEADSKEYYNELDSRVYKVYPDLRSDNDDKSESQPPVQRVASASVGGRQKTHSKKNGVTFTKSEVERLRGLKPHNMSEEAWLKSVAKEKQKIAQREAK
jgi:hypothetical protein